MSETLKTLLAEAMRLGREGRRQEATALIHRGLYLVRPFYHPSGQPARAAGDIWEGDFEFVEDVGPAGGFIIHGRYSHGACACGYRLYLPPGLGPRPQALLLMLHGCQQDATSFAHLTQMDRLADERGFIVLYPSQMRLANAAGCWNWFLPEHRRAEAGETALLASLAEMIAGRYGLPPERRYLAGFSAGGAMALSLAAAYPDRFAAIGVHSGLLPELAQDQLSALHLMRQGPEAGELGTKRIALPLIVFQGDADTRVNPRNALSIVQAALDGQGGVPKDGRMEEIAASSGEGLGYTCRRYLDPEGRPYLELWMVHGGGHGWFGGNPGSAFAEPQGPDASRELVRFFLDR